LIVERTENPQWLSNAYLVADEPGGTGVLIDGNDELGPLLERAERDGIEITHVLVTHPHLDHVAGLAEARQKLGNPPLVAHPDAGAEMDQEIEQTLEDGDRLTTGGLEIEAIHTPGHAAGHLAYLVNGEDVFTADVLFKGDGRRDHGPGRQRPCRPRALGDAIDGAAATDPGPSRPSRADHDRRGVGGKSLRPGVARKR
jgi:glyoxylase-like metal-dependent hydrolase (beta-lactamase superfamily II)